MTLTATSRRQHTMKDGRVLNIMACGPCEGQGAHPYRDNRLCPTCGGECYVCADCGDGLDVCECPSLEVDDG